VTRTKSVVLSTLVNDFLARTLFLKRYYHINDLIWQDGFLIDFLQKKVVDKWMRKFLVFSANLFNERLVFDWVVRFYIDLVLWPGRRMAIFEFNNVASTLFVTLLLLITTFLLVVLFYLTLLLF